MSRDAVAWRPAVVAGFLAPVLVVPLVVGVARLADARVDEDTGPTAAALDTGFTAVGAGCLGLLAVAALAAAAVRTERRIATGLAAGGIGYLVSYAVLSLADRSGDDTLVEVVAVGAAFAFFAAPFVAAGAVAGAGAGRMLRRAGS